jgi:hypothetical protein
MTFMATYTHDIETRELSLDELESEGLAELPTRDALSFFSIGNVNVAPVIAVNTALALNVLSPGATAVAGAYSYQAVGQVIR